jgi:hypothetical protein
MMVMTPMMVVPMVVVMVEARNYVNVRNNVMVMTPMTMVVMMPPVMVVILHLHQRIICGDRCG